MSRAHALPAAAWVQQHNESAPLMNEMCRRERALEARVRVRAPAIVFVEETKRRVAKSECVSSAGIDRRRVSRRQQKSRARDEGRPIGREELDLSVVQRDFRSESAWALAPLFVLRSLALSLSLAAQTKARRRSLD